ncbi:MAG: hypothetical protein IT379_04440 [Deltaproteobacteria bacterium]|nr:hypothetical protein [Deltaproteobacteria bacterium]
MSERPPPSPAQVALALAATGRVDAAHVLLEIALDEDPGDEESNEARERLLRLELEPLEPEETPRVFLGAPLVDAYVQGGLLREAQVIAQTLWSMTPDDAAAARRVKLFEQALAPLPDGASDELVRADALLREGAIASSLLAFRDAAQKAAAPAWARARAEALRALVLARDAPTVAPSRAVSTTDDTTRVGRDPRRVLALLHERNLLGAADEAKIAAASMGGEMPALAAALARLVEVANRVPRDSPESRSTLPMGRQGVADLHVRMASFDQAIALYRAVVEANPHDDEAREILEALRLVTRHMRTIEVERVDSVSLATPGEEVTRPALDLAPTTRPALDQTGELVLPPAAEVAEVVAVIEESTEPGSIVERTLHKVGAAPPLGDWALVSSQSGTLRGDEDTAITSPEVAAELALRQGYPERALALYRELARGRPEEHRFAQRIAGIERTLGLVVDEPPRSASTLEQSGGAENDDSIRVDVEELPSPERVPRALGIAGRPVRTPTGPYRSAPRRSAAATTPEDAPASAGGDNGLGSAQGPGPTVSPRQRHDTTRHEPTSGGVQRLPDLFPTIVTTTDVERARSPFDGLDEEETAVNVAASDLVRQGLLVGPAHPRPPLGATASEPLAAIATRVEELAPPTVRLPAVSEALARQMHASAGAPTVTRAADERGHAAPEARDSTTDAEGAPPTVRLQAVSEVSADPTSDADAVARPAVAARRIIPVGD